MLTLKYEKEKVKKKKTLLKLPQKDKIPRKNPDRGGKRLRLYYRAAARAEWHWHKTRHESIEQNREPRNKHLHLWSVNLQQRGKNIQ